MNNIKVIIFDYDGVISESVSIKTEAFAEIFKPYGDEVVRRVIEHHEANGGVSRFDKLKKYYNDFLGQRITQTDLTQIENRFSSLVLQKVIDAPYVPGAIEFISSNYMNFSFFISTGTPENEIEIILKEKNIRKYFKEVYGAPDKKGSHINKIIEKYLYNRSEIIFIGDSLADRDAARENEIEFIGRYTTSEEIRNEKYVVGNLFKINEIIDKC